MNIRAPLLFVILAFFFCASQLPGGHPMPPKRFSPERRQANMAMLRFQDALAAGHWDEALSLCSTRVRVRSKEWSSAEKFFNDTMPIEHVLAQNFACWSCGDKFYGFFVTLSDYDVIPRIDWYWGMALVGETWVVDYPPITVEQSVANKKAAMKERDERITLLRRELEPKVKNITTKLTPVSERFVIGSPMRFRLEVTNAGSDSVHYMDSGIQHYGLTVRDARGELLPAAISPAQIGVRKVELRAHSAVILGGEIGISTTHQIKEPGRYSVQFDSGLLQIGEPVPTEEFDRFGETLRIGMFDFFPATNKFPSNAIEIDVVR